MQTAGKWNRHKLLVSALCCFIGIIILMSWRLGAQDRPITIEPSVTLKATSTLTVEQAAFEQLLQDNNGCELPCWWGFELGKTSHDQWFTFLDEQPFKVFREEPLSNGTLVPIDSAYFSFPRSTTTTFLDYDFTKDILTSVSISLDRPNEWLSPEVTSITLPGLLAQLDAANQTPEIYMFIGGTSSSLDLPFLVVADDIGVMAEYTFNIYDTLPEPNDLRKWQYCLGLENTTYIEITVQDPQAEPAVSVSQRPSIEAKVSPHWVRLEDLNITPINSHEFIQFFLQNPNGCFVPEVGTQ
ncbi:MAG: hypothetical protein R3E39_26015 [Anaerolineae bacterium]